MKTTIISPNDSINKALSKAKEGDEIFLEDGIYKEKVIILKDNITLSSSGGAVITYSDHHQKTTGESATLTIGAKNIKLKNLRVENTFDFIFWSKENKRGEKKVDTQAVALRTIYGQNNLKIENCSLFSYQDTLYLDSGKHEIINSHIFGNIDFIFGMGEALIKECEIIALTSGYVSAPSTMIGEKGFTFLNCYFKAAEGVENGSVFLSRPWHPSGSENRSPNALFISPTFDASINRNYWTNMKSKTPFKQEKVWDEKTSRFLVINPKFN